jgi:multiple sugar transport system permease protein
MTDAPSRHRGPQPSIRGGHQRRRAINRALVYAVLIFGSVIMALPFYWMVTSSLKTSAEANAFPPTWVPGIERPENWRELGFGQRFTMGLGQIVSVRYWTEQLRWSNYPRAWDLETEDIRRDDGEEGVTLGSVARDFITLRWIWGLPAYAMADNPKDNFTRYFFNSTYTALTVTILSLLTAVLAAYALATMNFFGSGIYFFLIIGTLYIPGQILLIPNYIFFDYLGNNVSEWMGRNTYFVLIVPWIASVFAIFLLRQAFLTLPRDLFDAARIDGASRLRYLFVVVIPLSKPTLITAAIFNFLGTWNSLLWPLIMAPEPKYRTIMVGLSFFRTEAGTDYDLLMAASTFSILPIVIFFFFMQRYFIAGIARTGLK